MRLGAAPARALLVLLLCAACSAQPPARLSGAAAPSRSGPPPRATSPGEERCLAEAQLARARRAAEPADRLPHAMVGACLTVAFQDRLSSAFVLHKATFFLDGQPVFQWGEPERGRIDSAPREQPIVVFEGGVAPGTHTLNLELVYRGGGYGIFMMSTYAFKIRSSHTFVADEGRLIELHVTAYEKGGVTTPLEERPAIRYEAASIPST